MPATLMLTREQIEHYRASALRRREQEKAGVEHRREQAWRSAKLAAELLKSQFQVTRVVVFGSLLHDDGFTLWSDVDIAAWGIALEDTFKAIGTIADMDSEVPVNLVDVNTARPSLLAVIEQDGVDL